MTFGSLFTGIGGLDLGLERAGMQCLWQVEIDPFCRRVLQKHWPKVPKYGDIKQLSGNELESVDLICGGFPCQSVSLAGRRKAQSDERWLWPDFIRIVRVVRPRYVLVENTPGLASAGVEEDEDGEWIEARGLALGQVLGDLAESGYDAEWDCVPASAFGAPHLRYRVWIVAYANGEPVRAARRSGTSRTPGEVQTDCGERERVRPDADAARPDRTHPRTHADASPVLGEAVIRSKPDGDVQGIPARILADTDITGLQERQEQVMLEKLASAQRITPNAYGKRWHGRSGTKPESWRPELTDETTDYDGEPLVGAAIARGERHAWTAEPRVVRMVHGIPGRVDRIRALGNAVIPQVAEWIGLRILEAESAVQAMAKL